MVYPERMLANLETTRGLIYSSRVLLALVDTGMQREDAYAIVQRNAMSVWDDIQQARDGATLPRAARGRPGRDRGWIADEQLDAIFDPWAFLARVDVVFERLERTRVLADATRRESDHDRRDARYGPVT